MNHARGKNLLAEMDHVEVYNTQKAVMQVSGTWIPCIAIYFMMLVNFVYFLTMFMFSSACVNRTRSLSRRGWYSLDGNVECLSKKNVVIIFDSCGFMLSGGSLYAVGHLKNIVMTTWRKSSGSRCGRVLRSKSETG